MKRIVTASELVDIMQGFKTATFTSLDYVGEARLKKTGNPFPNATKACTLSGAVGAIHYSDIVEHQMDREGVSGNYVPAPRQWGERQGNLVFHKGEWYVEIKVQAAGEPVYYSDASCARQLDFDTEVKPFLPVKKEGERQPVENKVIWRDVKVSNIRTMRLDGDELVVK